MPRNFMKLLRARWAEGKFVCVGLDTDLGKIPNWFLVKHEDVGPMLAYNKAIIDATKNLVAAYKPNSAFYEALGAPGIATLQLTCEYIRKVAPDVPIIVDAKRGDIGSSNEGYARFLFEYLGADAVTLHPYLGEESLKPFLERPDKGVFLLCRTSNDGAREFQDLTVEVDEERLREIYEGVPVERETFEMRKRGLPLWQYLAYRVAYVRDWKKCEQRGLVTGATYPDDIRKAREIAPDLPFLIPGVGAQGATAEDVVPVAADSNGEGFLINSSRAIIFASSGEDFAEAAREKTIELSQEISDHLPVAA